MKTVFIIILNIICMTTCAQNTKKQMVLKTSSIKVAYLHLAGTGTATIDWGDGNSNSYELVDFDEFWNTDYERRIMFRIDHNYDISSNYTITVTGENIVYFESSGDNNLTDIDVSRNAALTHLHVGYNNRLKSVDVSANKALKYLKCYGNENLTKLNVRGAAALEWLDCEDNRLTSLDISQNTALTRLMCYRNRLNHLDVSKNTVLKQFHCSGNQLTELNLKGLTALEQLDCQQNLLANLDLSTNTAIIYLSCSYNRPQPEDAPCRGDRDPLLFITHFNTSNLM
jgi:hypothetical protein